MDLVNSDGLNALHFAAYLGEDNIVDYLSKEYALLIDKED
jgi:ankyrin repeat protein